MTSLTAILPHPDVPPNPGSAEAVERGCKCPVLDNYHGRGLKLPGYDAPQFWISSDCAMHSKWEAPKPEAAV